MDLKKVLDQTVREFKREVNKVLKVPEIEQKVLDCTSNEPWGPHGSVMGDIAQATRNYNDYQMIMAIIWKRINDTGRNWRHVYKALTLLEFLVAHGSERVIDELKEHSYQLSTLADFQYLDSSGKDQGLNVRKKSQSLVALINDKERIREVRQKAVENRDKYRGVSSTGGMYKPSSYSSTGGGYGSDRYGEDSYGSTSRYGGWDDDRYGRDKDGDRYKDDKYRDEDRYGRDWDRDGRDGDRSARGGDRYRDDHNRGYDNEEDRYNSRRGDDRQNDRYRSYERDRDGSYDEDDRHSSRSGGGRGDDYVQDDRRTDRKPSDMRSSGPPSYEEAVGSPNFQAREEERDGGGLAAAVARASRSNASQHTASSMPTPPPSSSIQLDDFDEFDPRASLGPPPAAAAPTLQADSSFGQVEPATAGARAVAPPPSTGLSSSFSSSSDFFGDAVTSGLTAAPASQQAGDLFGDSPFKAEQSAVSSFTTAPLAIDAGPTNSNGSGTNSSGGFAAAPSFSASIPAVPAGFNGDGLFGDDSFTVAFGAPSNNGPPAISSFNTSTGQTAAVPGLFSSNLIPPTGISGTFPLTKQAAPAAMAGAFHVQPAVVPGAFQLNQALPATGPGTFQVNSVPTVAFPGTFHASHAPPASGHGANQAPPPRMTTPLPFSSGANQGQQASLLSTYPRPQTEKKFETKSSVWADTLSKGLIDLNIGGPKTNPLADIGIDFDLLRKDRIKEESVATKASTVNMGKAMGSGTGLGLAGASAIVPPAAPVMMNSMGMGPGMGMNPAMSMGMGMGMATAMPMMQMGGMTRPNVGMTPGMGMGMGGYPNQQQQYGFR